MQNNNSGGHRVNAKLHKAFKFLLVDLLGASAGDLAP